VRRISGLLIALVTLALSAGAVLADHSMPSAATKGLGIAASASGKLVPVRTGAPTVGTNEQDTDANAGTHPDNHGKTVSEAAQATTPAGFDNHGAYVSSIAKQNAGQTTAASHRHTPPTVTPPTPPENPTTH
jgi:hypothetical protein